MQLHRITCAFFFTAWAFFLQIDLAASQPEYKESWAIPGWASSSTTQPAITPAAKQRPRQNHRNKHRQKEQSAEAALVQPKAVPKAPTGVPQAIVPKEATKAPPERLGARSSEAKRSSTKANEVHPFSTNSSLNTKPSHNRHPRPRPLLRATPEPTLLQPSRLALRQTPRPTLQPTPLLKVRQTPRLALRNQSRNDSINRLWPNPEPTAHPQSKKRTTTTLLSASMLPVVPPAMQDLHTHELQMHEKLEPAPTPTPPIGTDCTSRHCAILPADTVLGNTRIVVSVASALILLLLVLFLICCKKKPKEAEGTTPPIKNSVDCDNSGGGTPSPEVFEIGDIDNDDDFWEASPQELHTSHE